MNKYFEQFYANKFEKLHNMCNYPKNMHENQLKKSRKTQKTDKHFRFTDIIKASPDKYLNGVKCASQIKGHKNAENCRQLFETHTVHVWAIMCSLFPRREVELFHLKMVNYSLIYPGESSLL